MQTSRTRWLIALLVAVVMIMAACGNDDNDNGGNGEPSPTAATPDDPDEPPGPEEPEPAETGDESTEPAEPEETTDARSEETGPEPAPTPEPAPEIVLTATARGVTAETITIGVSYLDVDQLVQMGLSPVSWGDQEKVIQALVDDINNRGGINGRRVEVVMEKYSPLGSAEAEAACLRLTEDNEVFAVLFGFLGPAEVANTCIVGQQETILIGGTLTDERLAEAKAPWVTERAPRHRIIAALFSLLDANGELRGRSIAVVADPPSATQLDGVVDQLRELGIEPVLEITTSSPVGDIVAQTQEWTALAERIRTAGTDTVLLIGNPSAGIQNLALNGLEVDIWTSDASGLNNLGSNVDPQSAEGVITASSMTDAQVYESDPQFKKCLDTFNAAHPDIEIKHPDTLEEGEPLWFTNLFGHCRFVQMFELLATKAGPNLTHESFANAIETIGQFSIASQPYASLGPGKLASNDSFQLIAFDSSLGARGQPVPIGPLRDTTP
ncbi:ABC transporter substrate-binding protein [Candidatus Poriferisocius sp.]|uniref:ABC transporter substrate-binding protein n=1 Tax=Candidatus Poriferisocius sp. TaxID=3101276 RepID=UPI003B026747